MKLPNVNKEMQNRAFTFYIKDYDSRKKVYTLENPLTKEVKKITKEEFDQIYKNQPR